MPPLVKKRVLRLLLAWTIAAPVTLLAASQPEKVFDRITLADGLPGEFVTCIAQDSLGFMWLGTANGLARYDGTTITAYFADTEDSTSLAANKKEAYFGFRTAVPHDGTVNSLDANFEILAITDVDNDGYPDLIGRGLVDSTVQVWGIATATGGSEAELLAAGFQLHQNYPNPFNPSTMISYTLAQHGHVQLTIFNALGQTVRTLVNEHLPAGEHSLTWDGRDDAGHLLSSGPYFYRLKTDAVVQTRRMLFVK